jgi:hypothetical protein
MAPVARGAAAFEDDDEPAEPEEPVAAVPLPVFVAVASVAEADGPVTAPVCVRKTVPAQILAGRVAV